MDAVEKERPKAGFFLFLQNVLSSTCKITNTTSIDKMPIYLKILWTKVEENTLVWLYSASIYLSMLSTDTIIRNIKIVFKYIFTLLEVGINGGASIL